MDRSMDNYNLLFAQRLKQLRKQKHITQEKLAELIDRSPNHISKIEQGEINVPLNLVFKIAETLDIEPHELFVFDTISSNLLERDDILDEFQHIEDKRLLLRLYNIHKILLND